MKRIELLVQPAFLGLLTGTDRAEIDGLRVTLIYTDGERETATLTPAELQTGRDSWCAMVGHVQSKRAVIAE